MAVFRSPDPNGARRSQMLAVVVAGVLGTALLLGACGGGSDSPTAATPPKPTGVLAGDPALLEGRAIYAKYCASCHGVAGEGAPGTAFVGRRLLRTMPTAADEAEIVRKGRLVMPSFGETLTPAQVDAVVRYTREVLAPRPAPGSTS
jgi:mono/diheme cytochrome c family protein